MLNTKNKMKKEYKIAVWNANGLAQRTLELKAFLVDQNIDVMMISETHFTKKNYLKIHNYKVYNTNHPDGKAHGGTAIIIRSKICHYENEQYREDFLQARNITIKDNNGELTFLAVYCPPRFSINQDKFTIFFNSLGHCFMAGGDYNANHPW